MEATDETWDEFLLDVVKADTEFELKNVPAQQVTSPASINTTKYNCKTCGGQMELKTGTSKAGNSYKIMRCVNNPETSDKGGHSYWLK